MVRPHSAINKIDPTTGDLTLDPDMPENALHALQAYVDYGHGVAAPAGSPSSRNAWPADPGASSRTTSAELNTFADENKYLMSLKQAEVSRLQSIYPDISAENLTALKGYIDDDGPFTSLINPALREINPEIRARMLATPGLQNYIANMVSGMKKFPTYENTVYRSISLNPSRIDAFLEKYAVGMELAEPAFTSTSKYFETSRVGNINFVIHSKTGRDLSALNDDENAVLFSPDTHFNIISVSDVGGNIQIKMEEVMSH